MIGSSAATIAARSAAVSRGPSGSSSRAELHQRVQEDDLLAARVHGQGRDRAAAHAVGGEPARDPGRLRLQLGVGDLAAVGHQRGALGQLWDLWASQLSSFTRRRPVTSYRCQPRQPLDRRKFAATPQGSPARRGPYAPIEWRAAGEYGDIRYEKADGIAKITIDRPEVRNAFRPQTLAELRDAFGRARDDLEVGAILFTGAGEEAFCSGGTSGSAATTATSATTTSPSRASAASTSANCTCRSAACRSRWWRWSPATRSAAATSSTSSAT